MKIVGTIRLSNDYEEITDDVLQDLSSICDELLIIEYNLTSELIQESLSKLPNIGLRIRHSKPFDDYHSTLEAYGLAKALGGEVIIIADQDERFPIQLKEQLLIMLNQKKCFMTFDLLPCIHNWETVADVKVHTHHAHGRIYTPGLEEYHNAGCGHPRLPGGIQYPSYHCPYPIRHGFQMTPRIRHYRETRHFCTKPCPFLLDGPQQPYDRNKTYKEYFL